MKFKPLPKPAPMNTDAPTMSDEQALNWAGMLVFDVKSFAPSVNQLAGDDCILVWAIASQYDARTIVGSREYHEFTLRYSKRILSPAFAPIRERGLRIFRVVRDEQAAADRQAARERKDAALSAFSPAVQALLKEVSIDDARFIFEHEVLHYRCAPNR